MATIHYWIQLENHPWDAAPNEKDRMTNLTIEDKGGHAPIPNVTLKSPETGITRKVTMYKPLIKSGKIMDALILRRYKPPTEPDESDAWTVPDDRKVNPWDLNEPDPTDSGTMGTIPGSTIECNVGDQVKIHFRNKDLRFHIKPLVAKSVPKSTFELKSSIFERISVLESTVASVTSLLDLELAGRFQIKKFLPIEHRTHSLHTHGFVFEPRFDGAYPLSPSDPDQSIPVEEKIPWEKVGVTQFKKSDRVPPGGTFVYTWNTHSWPTTSNVWIYHDHSICDHENVSLGAIGMVVIHNQNNPQDILSPDPAISNGSSDSPVADLPGNSTVAGPLKWVFVPALPKTKILPHELEKAIPFERLSSLIGTKDLKCLKTIDGKQMELSSSVKLILNNNLIKVIGDGRLVKFIGKQVYRTPPNNAQYLQLYHNLGLEGDHFINGRIYLGNTPTMVAGPKTLMRFGVAAIGNDAHTFHIHGHRWVITGPDGNSSNAIQSSIQNKAISQFEDTRVLGPANSFAFTIKEEDSFMGAFNNTSIGEWHMHCHVGHHMMSGMMGSLLVVEGGEEFTELPTGIECPKEESDGDTNGGGEQPTVEKVIDVVNFGFNAPGTTSTSQPYNITVSSGTKITFNFIQGGHTMETISNTTTTPDPMLNNGGQFNGLPANTQKEFIITGTSGSKIEYKCGPHPSMTGSITIA